MHGRRALRGLLPAAAVALALGGCADEAVRAVPFDAADSAPCQEVARHWPSTIGPYEARVTAVQSEGVAAWGDPPIVARCGKTPPGPTTDPCIDVNGVDWVATRLDDGGTMFTTYGREPALEVLVPADYDSHPLLLPPLGEAAEAVPQTLGECSSADG
ncbi:DUF3515 family protein [Serinicoccus chungangensis]|uniref:DUF3515 family protein n=1 Tax=Serinicoccus chungangensis TaxID=767452 RepID=UPI00111A69B6|nr:DUF3515 family protein [Serinicoccus chungangensis]